MNEEILLEILNEVKAFRGELTEVKADIAVLKEDVAFLKTEMTEVKDDVTTLKSDVTSLKKDVAILKGDVSLLKKEQKVTSEWLSKIEKKQDVIFNQTAELSEFRTETNYHFTQLVTKKDMVYYNQKLIEHEKAIFELEQQI